MGWGIGGNSWVSVARGGELAFKGASLIRLNMSTMLIK